MTRALFLALSQNATIRHWMETSSAAQKVTRRFIAGETLPEEMSVCEDLAAEGIFTTADHLGENVTRLEEADAARDAYLQALAEIERRNIHTTVSLKLTALGLDLSEDAAIENLRTLAAQAKAIGTSVEVDMEDTRYTETTVRIVERVGLEFGNLRVAIQAYLYRTPKDIERLNRTRVMVRLCKGAYIEPPALAMPKKKDVDQAYVHLMRLLLDEGTYPAIGTHDEAMIGATLEHVKAKGYASDRFEFQMLHGVRRDLQRSLAKQGWRVRVYVPYGAAWYRYFMRRLAERPANVWFLAKNFFR